MKVYWEQNVRAEVSETVLCSSCAQLLIQELTARENRQQARIVVICTAIITILMVAVTVLTAAMAWATFTGHPGKLLRITSLIQISSRMPHLYRDRKRFYKAEAA